MRCNIMKNDVYAILVLSEMHLLMSNKDGYFYLYDV